MKFLTDSLKRCWNK